MDPGERAPVRIRFAEPFFGTASPDFPIPPGRGIRLHVVLTPNDIGVADFRETPVTVEGERLVLHWRDRAIPYAVEE